jgi:hypothetical protein
VLKGVAGGKVIGAFWWGAEYQYLQGVNLGGCENRSFFGGGGDLLPVAEAFGQLEAPLRLSASLTDGGLRLSWPLSGAGSSLMAATNLALPFWRPVTNPVQTTGTVFSTILPGSAGAAGFYRLQAN